MRTRIEHKLKNGERINHEEARYLYSEADLDDLSRWATAVRARFHHPDQATYLVMRIINYTNVCVAKCDYCAFYRLPNHHEAYVLSDQVMREKIRHLVALGGDFVGFNGGFNPKLTVDWYDRFFSSLRAEFGDTIEFYGMTIAELMYVARISRISDFEAARQLKRAGVRWITGGGSEILTNAFRLRHSPLKYSADEYIQAQRDVIAAGLNTTATMVIGFDESTDERIEHLERVRSLQDETGGLFSLLSWTYKPEHTDLGGMETSDQDYLRHLAVARIFVDNIVHMRTSVLTQNRNAFRGLRFGANDFDIPLEDEVTQMAGGVINQNIQEILQQCRDEGFQPVYRHVARNPVNKGHQHVLPGV